MRCLLDYCQKISFVSRVFLLSFFVLTSLYLYMAFLGSQLWELYAYAPIPDRFVFFYGYCDLLLLFCAILGFCLAMVFGSNVTTKTVFYLPVTSFFAAVFVYGLYILNLDYSSFDFSLWGTHVLTPFFYSRPIDIPLSFIAVVVGKKVYDFSNYIIKRIWKN
jgi:hypothetical protein